MRRVRVATGFVLGLVVAGMLVSGAWAGDNVWTTNGPEGGYIYALAIDPQAPETIYAGTWQKGGVFKSEDGGGTWTPINNGLPDTYGRNIRLSSLAVDPQHSDTVYVGTNGEGIFKSEDGGGTWVPINSGLANGIIYSLAIDPQASQTIYAALGSDGVFKSEDGGANWGSVNTGLSDVHAQVLAIDPQHSSTVYVGTYEGGILKSEDGGANWDSVSTGLTDRPVNALMVNPQDTEVIYAATNSGVFKSEDGGGSWASINTGVTDNDTWALAMDPQHPDTVYVGTWSGIFKSKNGGATWTPINTGLASDAVYALAIDPQVPQTIYAGTDGGGVCKSEDGGGNWTPVNTGLANLITNALAIDPQSPQTIYAGTHGGGVFRSEDDGGNWMPINSGLTFSYINALAIDPQVPQTIYAGTYQGVFKSEDGGGNWTPVNSGLTNDSVRNLVVDSQHPETIYAGTYRGVFKSIDGGTNWTSVNLTDKDVRAFAIDPQNSQTIYVGTTDSVFKSEDGGAVWTPINTGLTRTYVIELAIDPQHPQTIYAGTNGGVFKSEDGGANWTSIGLASIVVAVLAIDPDPLQTIYAGTYQNVSFGGGVFRSKDGGVNWTPVSGLGHMNVNALSIDPKAPRTVYAGSRNGVYSITLPVPLERAIHYVSPTGNDGNAGTLEFPWRTIGYAASRASAGDTIKVMDDGDETTDDYTESVTVDRRLTIERYDDIGANPQVAASDTSNNVFTVRANGVTIGGLDIYGATGLYTAGIYLDANGCAVQNNRLGWDGNHRNSVGIHLGSSCNWNTISDNVCSSNSDRGIYLAASSNTNIISGNSCSNNSIGIDLSSSRGSNTATGNTCSNNQTGLFLGPSNESNIVSGNTCSNNSIGIDLSSSNNNTVCLNNFFGNTANIHSDGSANTWCLPTKLGYHYGGSTHAYKRYMGNYYGDYSGSDGDNDGVGDSAYDLPDDEPDDVYPLMQPLDNYNLEVWWLANSRMYHHGTMGGLNFGRIPGASSTIWVADQPAQTDISFGAGDQSDSTTWTGQITFWGAPAEGDELTVKVGYADIQEDLTFWGPKATLTGDGSRATLTYITNAQSLTVPQGKYLALRIINNSFTEYYLKNQGVGYCYVAAPEGSQDYSLDVERVSVYLPDRKGVPLNRPRGIPVFVTDITGRGSISLQAVLTYDGSIIRPPDILTDGTMTEGWTVDFNVEPGTSPDTLKIAMATAEDALFGSGALFTIDVEPAEGVSVGDSTALHFESFRFNEDTTEVDTRDGVVYITGPRLLGDVTGNGEVTAYDAARILQYTVGLGSVLSEEDSVAADVSGRMGISAYDASLILQYVVDKIEVFPADTGGVDDPTAKALAFLRTISVGKAIPQSDGRFSAPILIDEMAGVVAGELTLSFSGNAEDVTVSTSALTSEYLLASNVQDGRIRASFAGPESSAGPGPVLEVVFDASDVELLSSLKLERASLNEGRIPVRVEGVASEVPTAYRLAQNYPNPFNPETAITYDIAKTGTVQLSIYALTGQQIRTLVNGERSAGTYSATWDGTDDTGQAVASGVYLCRMVSGDFSATRKLVLMK